MRGQLTTPEQLANRLKAHGIRQTPQRLAIAEVVINSGDHPSVKEIFERVKEFFPYVTLATVYSTLTVLEQAGIVRELPFQKQSRYDANLSPHANLVCVGCGSVSTTCNRRRGSADAASRATRATVSALSGNTRSDSCSPCNLTPGSGSPSAAAISDGRSAPRPSSV